MRHWWLSGSVRLRLLISLSGCLSIIAVQPGWAEEKIGSGEQIRPTITSQIPQLEEIELPATSAQILVQTPTPNNSPSAQEDVVLITGVKANPTDKGIEVILETKQGDKLQVINRSVSNNFVADITGGQLRLTSGETFTFRSEKPLAGITQITVINVDENTVRVTVVGEKVLPSVELFDDNLGLIFAVASTEKATQNSTPNPPSQAERREETQQDEPIELVVTGEQDGYLVPNASTATRTDVPLRDIPQSIQVVPQQVLEDRKIRGVTEAVETVSGVIDGGDGTSRIIRGFFQGGVFRNGYRDINQFGLTSPIETVNQVEVLKGPASVLYGAVEPGGIINITSKKPLSEPYYKLALDVGNYGFYKPSIDLSGPLNADKTALYRFIASYQNSSDFQGFANIEQTTLAPSITLNLGTRTKLDIYYEYAKLFEDPLRRGTALFSDNSLLPRNLYLAYPNFSFADKTIHRYGYEFKHEFSNNWQIRNSFSGVDWYYRGADTFATNIINDSSAEIAAYDFVSRQGNYFGQIDLVGKFQTGSVSHQLLAGFDVNRDVTNLDLRFNGNSPPLDILNPNYNVPKPEYDPFLKYYQPIQSYGLYLQDQITFNNRLKLLIGGRYDWVANEFEILGDTTDDPVQKDAAFSPRIGLVYQPSDNISLYASYSRSFRQTQGFNPDGRAFKPTRGTQYEVGVKTDFLDRKLSTTLAAYQITKTNVTTTDPNNPLFSIQTGEQQSQGIELDITGEILPGWSVIASYAYTDAKVTVDNAIPVGNQLTNVPYNQASLWTTYEIQKGDLKGLGFGLGLFYVGKRQGDLANSFQLADYLRTDAALYYRRNGFKTAINIRNLLDKDYASYGSGRTYIERGAPFTITGSISWEF